MATNRMAVAIMVQLLLATAAATSSSELALIGSTISAPVDDLASKMGIRRLLQDGGDCIPNYEVCCSNCGWFERTNCCDPDNYVCQYWPEMDPAHGQDWCIPRNYWVTPSTSSTP